MQTHILGFPRIGRNRELKKALEGYWKGELSENQLHETADELKKRHWKFQHDAGLSFVTVGDFSLYDHVLDLTVALGAIPHRFQNAGSALDTYFAMARGDGNRNIPAMEMTKWFNTNYHYIVPELSADQSFKPSIEWLENDVIRVGQLGFRAKPVLLGPITYLALSKGGTESSRWDSLPQLTEIYISFLERLAPQCDWIQIDEPILCTDMSGSLRKTFRETYHKLRKGSPSARTLLTTYFGSIRDNLDTALASECSGLHLDLCAAPAQLSDVLAALPEHMHLSLGVVDGRNIWKTNCAAALSSLRNAALKLGSDRLFVGSSSSLLHVPVDLELETSLDPEIKNWMAFAVQKCGEIALLGQTIDGEWSPECLNENRLANESRHLNMKTFDPAVRRRCRNVTPEMLNRKSPYADRYRKQQEALNLPLFPTTTIGSYPQTEAIRKARREYRKGELSPDAYEAFLKDTIREIVGHQEALGLDVLVHGEPERTDMVEYFGQQLEGFCFTDHGWVQSYGSRCVKPPVLYGDVSRKQPMTASWLAYAQSLTRKPMKGMLTGPVTILCWSFVRDDLEREEVCRQLALALRDEVLDLEAAGIKVIQIDEAALREKLPLRKSDWHVKYLDWAVPAFRLVHSAVKPTTQIHTHMCYSEFNDIIRDIDAMDADVISFEASRGDLVVLDAIHDAHFETEAGPGVYDIHSPRIPSEKEIEDRIYEILDKMDVKKVWINPDCGLKTRGNAETWPSLENLVAAAKAVRAKLDK